MSRSAQLFLKQQHTSVMSMNPFNSTRASRAYGVKPAPAAAADELIADRAPAWSSTLGLLCSMLAKRSSSGCRYSAISSSAWNTVRDHYSKQLKVTIRAVQAKH